MKKIMNDSDNFVDDSLKGMLRAYSDRLICHRDDPRAIVRVNTDPDKVPIVTGGGFGHIPLFLGYVGDGLCDGVAVGSTFTTPSCDTIVRATELLPHQNGVLYILGNYTGDTINFQMAAHIMGQAGIRCEQVIVADDVLSAPKHFWTDRRCIAGIVLVYKIAGACARRGDSLDEIVPLLGHVNKNLASVGMALTSCHIPNTKKPIFDIGPGEIELGIGIHGESGVKRVTMAPSCEIAKSMTDIVVGDLGLVSGDRAVLLLNGMSSLPKDELFILYGDIMGCMDKLDVRIERSYVGEFATALDMSGVSLTLLRFEDEYTPLLDSAASSPFVSFLQR